MESTLVRQVHNHSFDYTSNDLIIIKLSIKIDSPKNINAIISAKYLMIGDIIRSNHYDKLFNFKFFTIVDITSKEPSKSRKGFYIYNVKLTY